MKPLMVVAAVALVAFSPAALCKRFYVPETHMYFDAPEDFERLDQALIDAKFPSRNAPDFVVGNERASTTIGCSVSRTQLSLTQLEQGLITIGDAMARLIPGHQWIARKMIDAGGTRWAYFEMTSTAIDTDIHNIVLMTAYPPSGMLLCNFNATVADFERLEPELRASIASIGFEQ